MTTCVGSVRLLRTITFQLGKLSISGGRHIHVCTTTGLDTVLKKDGLANKVTVTDARQISGHCGVGGNLKPLPSIAIVFRENKEITDKDKPQITYDCPKIPGLNLEIDMPPSENTNLPFDNPEQREKIEESPESSLPELKLKQKKRNRRKNQHITIIRHIKMKRHQLRRVRKRLWPIRKKEVFLRRKKQEREFEAYLDKVRSYGRNFDAAQYVRECLEKAKKAGYQFDINPTVNMLKGKSRSQ